MLHLLRALQSIDAQERVKTDNLFSKSVLQSYGRVSDKERLLFQLLRLNSTALLAVSDLSSQWTQELSNQLVTQLDYILSQTGLNP